MPILKADRGAFISWVAKGIGGTAEFLKPFTEGRVVLEHAELEVLRLELAKVTAQVDELHKIAEDDA